MSKQNERLGEQLAAAKRVLQDLRMAQHSFRREQSKRAAKSEVAITKFRKLVQKAEPLLARLSVLLQEVTALSQTPLPTQADTHETETENINPAELARHFRDLINLAQSDARNPKNDVAVSLKSLDVELRGLIVVEKGETRLVTPTPSRLLDAGQLSTMRLKFGSVPLLSAPADDQLSDA